MLLTIAVSLLSAVSGVAAQNCTDPQGLQYGIYQVDLPENNPNGKAPYFAAFDPTVIKKEKPEFKGITPSVGFFGPNNGVVQIYGSPEIQNSNFIVSHRGYIKAPQGGTYTITLTKVDDVIEVWLGDTAYTQWNRMNYVIQNSNLQRPMVPVTLSFKLSKGAYIPLRIVFGQAAGDANLAMSIAAPDGTVLLDGTSALNENIVQFSCSNARAPKFPRFGNE